MGLRKRRTMNFSDFDSNPVPIFVIDVPTRHFVYMNEAAKKFFNVPEKTDIASFTCHKLAHNRDEICPDCKLVDAKAGYQIAFGRYNHTLEKYLRHHSLYFKSGGKDYTFNVISGEGIEDDIYKALEKLESAEHSINSAVAKALQQENYDNSIRVLIREVAEKYGCNRAYLMEQCNHEYFSDTYEWCREGVPSVAGYFEYMPYQETLEHNLKLYGDRNYVYLKTEDYRGYSEEMYQELTAANVYSSVSSPLYNPANGEFIGAVGFDDPKDDKLGYIYNILPILAKFLTLFITQRENQKKNYSLSFEDQLTGVMNRHALYRFLNEHPDRKFTYYYFDINELKKGNDLYGHAYGDKMIQNAARSISELFGRSRVFRMGGDEFLAIHDEIGPQDILRLDYQLGDIFHRNLVSISFGHMTGKGGEKEFDALFASLDKEMYKAKKIYHNIV